MSEAIELASSIVGIVSVLREEKRPRSLGYLARKLGLGKGCWPYVQLLPALKVLSEIGVVEEYHSSGSGGGSNRMVRLL